MKIRIFLLLTTVAVTAIFLFTSVQEVKSSPSPGRGARGKGSKSWWTGGFSRGGRKHKFYYYYYSY